MSLTYRMGGVGVAGLVATCGFAAVAVVVGACGARSRLVAFDRGGEGGSAAGGANAGGEGGSGGMAPDLPPCVYQPAGDPMVLAALPDQHATSPSLVAIDAKPESGLPEIAVQYIASGGSNPAHATNQVLRLHIPPLWPPAVPTMPIIMGLESHSYARFTRSLQGDRLAMSWYSDLNGFGRVAFRTLNVATHALGPLIDIDAQGLSAVALEAGAGLGAAGLEGSGYGIVWRQNLQPGEPRSTVMAVLDEDGAIASGPHDTTPLLPSPPASALVWNGSAYLVATAYGNNVCPPDAPLCHSNSIVIARYRPPSGDGMDDSGIDVVDVVEAIPGIAPGRPRLAHYAGRTWMAWTGTSYGVITEAGPVRLAELAADGSVMGTPTIVGEGDLTMTGIFVTASDQGISLTWLTAGDEFGPPNQPGASLLHALALDHDGVVLEEMAPLPVTLHQGATPSTVALSTTPRSLVVTWSGRRIDGGYDDTFLARLNCVER